MMSDELNFSYLPGQILYNRVMNRKTGRFYNQVTLKLEYFMLAHWEQYALLFPELEQGSGQYRASAPPNLPAGSYLIETYAQLDIPDNRPTQADGPPIADGVLEWDGRAEFDIREKLELALESLTYLVSGQANSPRMRPSLLTPRPGTRTTY
jgi:hypothetical protein